MVCNRESKRGRGSFHETTSAPPSPFCSPAASALPLRGMHLRSQTIRIGINPGKQKGTGVVSRNDLRPPSPFCSPAASALPLRGMHLRSPNNSHRNQPVGASHLSPRLSRVPFFVSRASRQPPVRNPDSRPFSAALRVLRVYPGFRRFFRQTKNLQDFTIPLPAALPFPVCQGQRP